MSDNLRGEADSDEALIREIVRANESALHELYERYKRLVFSIALNSVGSEESAKEITQDVFLRVWQSAYSYKANKGKVYTWLARMARNRAIDMLRRRSARPSKVSLSWSHQTAESQVSDSTPETLATLEEDRRRVQAAVAALPGTQKEAIALAYYRGYSHSEIAEALDLPLGTVKGRIRAGMKKLKNHLEREEKPISSETAR